jgi:dihydrofolate reductase
MSAPLTARRQRVQTVRLHTSIAAQVAAFIIRRPQAITLVLSQTTFIQGGPAMRKIRYQVAMSLDGYIGAPNGDFDWIVVDPEIDFAELWAQFDTLLMGRRTYEPAIARLGKNAFKGMKTFVASHSLRQTDYPEVTIVSELSRDWMTTLRAESSKDIWLMGGGALFRSLLEMGEVDTVEVHIIPVLLGGGVPLLPHPAQQTKLKLSSHKVYRSGGVSLLYDVQH